MYHERRGAVNRGHYSKKRRACKPGSVPLSGPPPSLWPGGLPPDPERPTRRSGESPSTVRPCSQRGLPCRPRRRERGGLLPRRFTLTDRREAAVGVRYARFRSHTVLSVAHGDRQFAFCCAISRPRIAPKRSPRTPGSYPALRSREPGLSSPPLPRGRGGAAARPAQKTYSSDSSIEESLSPSSPSSSKPSSSPSSS